MEKITLTRAYFGWTDKAALATRGAWIPKKYIKNWTEEKPPKLMRCELPDWFVKKNKQLTLK